jgi:hypothetical protein
MLTARRTCATSHRELRRESIVNGMPRQLVQIAVIARLRGGVSAPGVTRTPGQRFRKPLLYPPELRGQVVGSTLATYCDIKWCRYLMCPMACRIGTSVRFEARRGLHLLDVRREAAIAARNERSITVPELLRNRAPQGAVIPRVVQLRDPPVTLAPSARRSRRQQSARVPRRCRRL